MRYHRLIIIVSILVGVILATVVWLKFFGFQYNAMDSAIFVNTIENFIDGRGFYSSIQGGRYFADHLSPIIMLPAILYYIWQSPLTLLFFQVLMSILPVWPLYLIARRKLSDQNVLLVVLAYFFNPLVWNLAIFEFELLPLAIFGLLYVYYFYLQKRWWPFLACLVLSVLVREDVALWFIGFGFWSLWSDRRSGERPSRYSWVSLVAGVVYFFVAVLIIRSIGGGYKFTEYYNLVGIWSWSQLELIIGLLLPFAFLPLLRPRTLLPVGLIYLQFAAMGGLGSIVVKTHYSSLFVPTLFFALIEALHSLESPLGSASKYLSEVYRPIVIVAIIYSFVFLGPVSHLAELGCSATEKSAINYLLEQVPPGASVASSYDFLTPLASRSQIYSLNYVFLGTRQLSREPYNAPDVDYVLWNSEDMLTYQLQYERHQFYGSAYLAGTTRIEDYLNKFDLIFQVDNFYLFRNKHISGDLPEYSPPLGYAVRSITPPSFGFSQVSFYNASAQLIGNSASLLSLRPEAINYQVPELADRIKFQPVTVTGSIILNNIGSTINDIRTLPIGAATEIIF
jgi:uncharacterized membrane protein